MKTDVLLGLQWGDEERRIVDVLTNKYDIIARFQGGPKPYIEFDKLNVYYIQFHQEFFTKDSINIIEMV